MVDQKRVSALKTTFGGNVYLPADPGYDEAHEIWNGMFDKKPAVIARCLNQSDVAAAVNFGRENNLLIAVKGGGHNTAGTGSCEDGLMIDLSLMQPIRDMGETLGDGSAMHP